MCRRRPGSPFAVPRQTEVRVAGIDKQLVGEIAARIRACGRRSPTRARACATPAKRVRRKEGKKK